MCDEWAHTAKTDVGVWKALVYRELDRMARHYGAKRGICAGLDCRRSKPFVQRDLLRHSSDCFVDDDTSMFVSTTLLRVGLYLSLLVSYRAGAGRRAIDFLATTDRFSHRFLVTRATNDALGFYLRLGMQIVDWNGAIEDGTISTDDDLTRRLVSDRSDASLAECHRVLVDMGWIDDDFVEWPLIIRRQATTSPGESRHRSLRLRNRSS